MRQDVALFFWEGGLQTKTRNGVPFHPAKGLLDKGYMAPTVYFPLVVPECMMVEPTETESKDTLDTFATHFAEVLQVDAETLHAAPITTPVRRVDEVYAARNLCLRHEYDDE